MMTSPAPSPNDLTHFALIKDHLPSWLIDAPQAQRSALRQSLIASCHSRHDVQQVLAKLQSPEQFVRPLLEQAIAFNFRLSLDVEQATFVHVRKNGYFFGLISVQGESTEQTLLSAALSNFDKSLTSADTFGAGSGIYSAPRARGSRTHIKPEEFALVCRRLDFGSLYQALLRAILQPPVQADAEQASSVRDVLIKGYTDAFAVTIHLAGIKGDISIAQYRVLLKVLSNSHVVRYGTHPYSRLKFLGLDLSEVLVIGLDAEEGTHPCIVYIPQDPISPLARYDSLKHFEEALSNRLLAHSYAHFFSRFLPSSDQETPLKQIIKRALWQKWRPKPAVPAPDPSLLTLHPVKGNVFKSLHEQRVRQIERHGREAAIPTSDIDTQARQRLLQAYEKAGLSTLALAVSFMPLIGEVLLISSGVQLITEVYQGFDAWRRHEKVEALNDLMDIAEQVALMGASAGAIKTGRFVNSLIRVKPSTGTSCLWKPDLLPYRQPVELPEALTPDEQGLYNYQDRHYLSLDEQLYEVSAAGDPRAWSIRHPSDPRAYSPPLLENGAGAWRTSYEKPQDWDDLKRLKRLGPIASGLQHEDLAPILHASATDSKLLLQLHLDNQSPPAQLVDTLKRFRLDRQTQRQRLLGSPPDSGSTSPSVVAEPNASQHFESLYRNSEHIDGPLREQIRQDLPTLPKSYVQALEKSIAPAEEQQILRQKSLLPYLKDEAELSMQNVDTARLYEGLYLPTTFNPASDQLAFHTLEALPGWSGDVRLELYANSLAEPPLGSVGNPGATTIRRLLREGSRYRVYAADGRQTLAPNDLYSAIRQALPDTELDNLGAMGPDRNMALKQVLIRKLTQLTSSPTVVRQIPTLASSVPYHPGIALDTHFALKTPPSDLTPVGDGLYRNAFFRHYIQEQGRYYQVESSDLGWKLIDARSPFRCYRPVIQRKAGTWEINTDIGLKGGAPGPGQSKIELVESEAEMVSALEYVKPEPFTAEDLQRMKVIKSYQRAPNRMGDYDRVNNGRYPLRGLSGNPLRIKKIQHMSEISESGIRYPAKDILPYLKWEAHEQVAKLYEEKLLLREFTEQDAKFPQEQSMIGQAMVVARKPLEAGEAIGVYGGGFIPFHVSNARQDPFVIDILPDPLPSRPKWDRLMLSGDNIISRINSIFEYEENFPVRQATGGYNVEGAVFPVDVDIGDGRLESFRLNTFFTTRAIPADEELRWNYGYTEAGVRTLFAPPEETPRT
ncbi:SET domain-containing protein [Pseudomonas sp. FEN]|uniref:SET domain-containing protein n=1 Tax=Pseudomonas sp. FEN TaxID=2767468 RepID=UPI00174BFE28|nr:SET domain-containing protein [Pseudomonas sp. FEN]CAD5203634.1 hypothetical protein [Pseudomonas sp. FEN]